MKVMKRGIIKPIARSMGICEGYVANKYFEFERLKELREKQNLLSLNICQQLHTSRTLLLRIRRVWRNWRRNMEENQMNMRKNFMTYII